MDVYICSTVYSTPEWSYSVTHKHTHTQTHKANLKESRIYISYMYVSYSLLNLLCVFVCVFVTEYDHSGVLYTVGQIYPSTKYSGECSKSLCLCVTEYGHSGVLYTVEQIYPSPRSTSTPGNVRKVVGFSNIPRSTCTTWGWIYLFYSIQYSRVVILRNTHTVH